MLVVRPSVPYAATPSRHAKSRGSQPQHGRNNLYIDAPLPCAQKIQRLAEHNFCAFVAGSLPNHFADSGLLVPCTNTRNALHLDNGHARVLAVASFAASSAGNPPTPASINDNSSPREGFSWPTTPSLEPASAMSLPDEIGTNQGKIAGVSVSSLATRRTLRAARGPFSSTKHVGHHQLSLLYLKSLP